MKIKNTFSKLTALLLCLLMLATSVYTGFSAITEVSAESVTYQRALDCFEGGRVPGMKFADRWSFNILDIGDTTNPQSPEINSIIVVSGLDTNGKTVSPYYQSSKKGFTTRNLYAAHRTKASLPFYSFVQGEAGQEVKFHMVDDGTYTYGAQYLFRINQTHVYDFQANLRLVDANGTAGAMYYRAVAIAEDGTKTVVWPKTGSWYSVEFSEATGLTPELAPVEFDFPVGTLIGVECYADLTAGTDLTVGFGSPTINNVTSTSDGAKQYELLNYSYYQVYGNDASISEGNFFPNKSRFNFYYFNTINDSKHNALELYDYNYYHKEWDLWQATIVDSTNTTRHIGFHMPSAEQLYAETGNGGGVAYDFVAPRDGNLSMSLQATNYNTAYIRVLLNDTVIFPESGAWSTCNTSGNINLSCAVSKNDRIVVQTYSEEAITSLNMAGTVFTLSEKADKNMPSDKTFGAAFANPYLNEEYTGSFTPKESDIWKFYTYNVTTHSRTAVNYFDSANNNFLYNSGDASVGFHFDGNDLLAAVVPSSDANSKGVSLEFAVPVSGQYDVSTAADILEGTGNAKYRICLNGAVVFPENGEWYSANSADACLPDSIFAVAGDKIYIDYIVTDSTSSEILLNLGTVNIYKVPDSIPSSTGFWTDYEAFAYAPYTIDGFNGNITYQPTRFEFGSFNLSENKSTAMTKYDNAAKLLSSDFVSVSFADSALETTATAGNGAEIKFVPSVSAEAKISFTPNGENAKYRILCGDETVIDWTDADGTDVEPTVNVIDGKAVKIQMYTSADGAFSFGSPTVSINNGFNGHNKDTDEIFYPLNSNPYANSDYEGDYNQKTGRFMFNTMSVSKTDGAVSFAPTNYFKDKKLYNKANGAGYVFESDSLKFDFTDDDSAYYGMNLEFISPKAQGYDIGTMIFTPATATATAHLRITKNGEKLWPEDTDWNIQKINEGDIIKFPLLEFEANKSDKVAIDLYFTGIAENEAITVDLGSPYVKTTAMSHVVTPDAEAKVYAAKDYNPYLDNPYAGTANLVESRWNFEFFDLIYGQNDETDTITAPYQATTYNYGWNRYLYVYKNGQTGSGYHINNSGNDINVELYNETDRAHGLYLRYVSPLSGSVRVTGNPGILPSALVDGAEFYFRVMVNDTVIFPTTGDWCVANEANNGYIGFTGIDANLEIGDEVIYQYVLKTPAITSHTKVAQFDLGNPSIVVISKTNNDKLEFSQSDDFTPDYQLSPYWNYMYAPDATNPEYQEMSRYIDNLGSIWAHSTEYLAVGKRYMWIMDSSTYAATGKHGAVASQFTANKDGEIVLLSQNLTCQGMPKAYARITLNGENVWPAEADSWEEFEYTTSYDDIIVEVNKGDVIRFEATMSNESAGSWASYIWWTPTLRYQFPQDFTYEINDQNEVTITGYIGKHKVCSIPNSINEMPVTAIGDNAFYMNRNIKKVYIPDSVKRIGVNAFRGCTKLENVLFSEGLETIDNYAFGRTALTTVSFPRSLKNIGTKVFYDTDSISLLEITGYTRNINKYICENPANVTIKAPYGSSAHSLAMRNGYKFEQNGYAVYADDFIYEEDITSVRIVGYKGPGGVVIIPETYKGKRVESIAPYAFIPEGAINNRTVTELIVPSASMEFEINSCRGLVALEKVIINSRTPKTLPLRSFMNCIKLKEVYLSDNISINSTAFQNCKDAQFFDLAPDYFY